ncbi:MAG: hypothetical protein LBH44_05090 [Treponema sp.]|nr:hypothetical protein [Treponema sp.]
MINDYIDSDYHFKKRYYEINYPDMVYPYLPFRFDEVYTVKAALWQNVWYNLGGWSKQKRYIQTGAPENWEIR